MEVKDYIATVPKVINEVQEEINQLWRNYNMLDKFGHRLETAEFSQKWTCFVPRTPAKVCPNFTVVHSVKKKGFRNGFALFLEPQLK